MPDDANYEVYFSFYDSDRRILGQELPVASNKSSFVEINVSSTLTDLLRVDSAEEYAEYYYGIKICDPITRYEETLIIGDKEIGELNVVTVYPKQVEGISNSMEV